LVPLKPRPDLKEHVEFYPAWRTELRFFVEESRWPHVRPWVEALKRHRFPRLTWGLLGHTTDEREGVRFGCEDRDAERQICEALGIGFEAPKPSPSDEPKGKPGRRNLYPFDQLQKVGDHFLVTDKAKSSSLSTTCRYHESLYPDRLYRVCQVREGVLVVLVQHETAQYERVL
jgi:hypothetical protein